MGRSWHRLKRRSDFLDIAGHGLRRNTPAFVVQAKSRDLSVGMESPRIGFTASRKVGNAVARNRAKRRLRALCDATLAGLKLDDADLSVPTGASRVWDFVLIARTEATTRDFAAMAHELRKALERLVTQTAPPKGQTR